MRDAGWADEDDGLIAIGVGVEGGIGGGGVMLINQIRSGQGSHSFHSLPETAREGGRKRSLGRSGREGDTTPAIVEECPRGYVTGLSLFALPYLGTQDKCSLEKSWFDWFDTIHETPSP
jgi:hypothetical protein